MGELTEQRSTPHHICQDHPRVEDHLIEGAKVMAALVSGQTRMQEQLDIIMERQLAYVAETAQMKQIVTNGLSHNVQAIKDRLDEVCVAFERRLAKLESFAWFRDKITFLRDYIFWIVLGGGLVGGMVYMLLGHRSEVVKKIIGG